MFDRKFISSRLGQTAMLSIVAMLSFNVLALTGQLHAAPARGTLLMVQAA